MEKRKKEKIYLLNIPNYYCSFYLFSLDSEYELIYKFEERFEKFNHRAFLIFLYRGKYAVICNNDPSGPKPDLYEWVDYYFMTNKSVKNPLFQQEKLIPLFPHYPVNALKIFLKLFGFSLLKNSIGKVMKDLHVLNKRPTYSLKSLSYSFHNYVFFAANLWKKEPITNQLRAEFIRICKEDKRIDFEGGFVARQDGDDMGYDQEIAKTTFSPKNFSNKSANTLIALNNPAVLGALSWRFAEYLMNGVMILSYPLAIELPKLPIHGEEIHYVNSQNDIRKAIDQIFNNPDYHKKIALGSRSYFERYCTPAAQVQYITKIMNESTDIN